MTPGGAGGAAGAGAAIAFATMYAAPLHVQLGVTLRRAMAEMWHNPTVPVIRVFVYLFIGIFFALTFLNTANVSPPTQTSVQSTQGLLFSSTIFAGIAYLNTGMPQLFALRPIYYREKAAHFYLPLAYAVSVILRDVPFLVFYALLFSSLTYFANGLLVAAGPFFTYVCALVFLLLYYGSLAAWLSSVMPNAEVAGILGGIIISLTNLFGGLQIPPANLAQGWMFLYVTDGVAWALRLNSMTQFDPSVDRNNVLFSAPNPVTGTFGPISAYNYVSQSLVYTFEQRWQAIGWLALIFTFFNLLAILGYRFVDHNKR